MLSPTERAALNYIWNAICVFLALWYLAGGIWKAALVAGFVLLSTAFGYGARWLVRGGFALSILAIAVLFGFPSPDQWADIARTGAEQISAHIRLASGL